VPGRYSDVIGSEIVVAVDDRYFGEIIVADPLRPEAAEAIGALNRLGIKTVLMTGDTETVAKDVAARLGISELIAHMLPEDKLTKVRELVASKRMVAMVGDGVNDAPALTAAHVGIAMGSGTDIAKESADLVLIGNDLGKLVETMMIAQKTRAIIWQNFAGTIGVDTIGIVLASMGYLNPLLAALIHVGSELVFLSNSARLLDYHFKTRPTD
jgi:P-type E1-E2 ATPase